MAAIGSIRKHGVLLLVIIGLALLAFILGDLSNVTRVFSNKNIVAKVDGKKIDQLYDKQYKENSAYARLLQGKNSLSDDETFQLHEFTWQNILQNQAIDKQLEKLGMTFTDQMIDEYKEKMIASLNTQQPHQSIIQFASALAQQGGPEYAMSIISHIDELANNEQGKDIYDAWQAMLRLAVSAEKTQQYMSLVQGSIYFSDPMAKQFAKDNKTAMVSLATINPDLNAFQNIKPEISDKEIKEYYNTHKDELFTLQSGNRDINVAVFPIGPTPADLKALEDSVRKDFAAFSEAEGIAEYNASKGNAATADSTFYKKEDIILQGFDSIIFNTPVGSFIQPFTHEEQGMSRWFFGKVFGAANRPDSVLVARIELPFKTAQYQEAPYSKKEARLKADSLKDVILSNQTTIFAEQPNYLYGRDQGDSTLWLAEHATPADIYNNLLTTPNGGIYIYKAPNGYILFQVLDRTQLIEKRQFALYNYDIVASEATFNELRKQANQFAASINSNDELISNAAKQGIQVVNGTNVTSMATNIGQLGSCHEIVGWSFGDDVKKDNISDVFNINRMYLAVASVAKVRESGVQKYNDVKDDIKTMLERKKKTEMVAEQLNNDLKSGNMSSVAQKYTTAVTDSVALIFAGDYYMNRGVEGKAIGQIFNLPVNTPKAVAGDNMAYMVNVMEVRDGQASENLMMEKNYLQNAVFGRDRNESTLFNYLMNQMKVIDNRVRFYQSGR